MSGYLRQAALHRFEIAVLFLYDFSDIFSWGRPPGRAQSMSVQLDLKILKEF
jgi:hypothetical protein